MLMGSGATPLQVHASEHGPASAADREAAGNLRIGRVQRQKVGPRSRHPALERAFTSTS